MASSTVPMTPGGRNGGGASAGYANVEILIQNLNMRWDLHLEPQKPNESPSTRAMTNRTVEQRCVYMITVLNFKKLATQPLAIFQEKASSVYMQWVKKPKANRGVIPEVARDRTHPLSDLERKQMLGYLHDILREQYDDSFKHNKGSQSPWRSTKSQQPQIHILDDSPVPFALTSSKQDPKRPREDPMDETLTRPKKYKNQETLFQPPKEVMPPSGFGGPEASDLKGWRSANTSFGSNAASSIFSNPARSFATSISVMGPSTQETVPDTIENHKSSDYGARSSFEAALVLEASEISPSGINGLSQELKDVEISNVALDTVTPEDVLESLLEDVFPKLPKSLMLLPIHIMYEVTRVFLHAQVPVQNAEFPLSDDLNNYDVLWRFLRTLPVLKEKPFPERSSREAWNAAATAGYSKNGRAVVLAGSLEFNENPTGPLFNLRLKPLQLDLSHRLGRRLGNDRFLEIDMPHLIGKGVPNILQDLGALGQDTLFQWLVNGPHSLFGRCWNPFFCIPVDRKTKKSQKSNKKVFKDDPEFAYRIYFFAVSGGGLPTKINIQSLLDMVRLERENKHQPYLKLFSRTKLALSRNSATVILERSQIRYKDDIRCNGEVMTDGAGRISFTLALEVMQILGLTYPPSGFQGRIGEAKGFWSVDHNDRSKELWIEVYQSQCKWVRSQCPNHPDHHESNRTFEVLQHSGPLKSANLNEQFLPLLMENAIDKPLMKKDLNKLLELGLDQDLETLRCSLDDALLLRKWISEKGSSNSQRLKSGRVAYRAGLPIGREEQLIMMLDSGFDATKLTNAMDLTRNLFRDKCEDLKTRFNITVGRSTYAYMVPDFSGVLEPDEVFIDFSTFTDEVSGFSGIMLHGQEILVARSPAHFASDVQKVKAVPKAELMGLKDVIVFPIKGNLNLAAKLSGGDYDGDRAWICWEPSIVRNFKTADKPKEYPLVAEGYVHQDSTKYEDLVKGHNNPVSYFLQKSMAFNMQQSMLGICTTWKDKVCYHQDSVATSEAVIISSLLSLLVDQAKQGYSFNNDDLARLKKDLIKVKPFEPEYKSDNPYFRKDPNHILDFLVCRTYKKVNKCLEEFARSAPKNISPWDEDLVACSKWAKNELLTNDEWKALLLRLDKDLLDFKKLWQAKFSRSPLVEELALDFIPIVLEFFEKYQGIQPLEGPLGRTLLGASGSGEFSSWELLKASTLFASYPRKQNRPCAWWMAGKQLAHMKALRCNEGAPHTVVPSRYIGYRPNNSFIKQLRSQNTGASVGLADVEDVTDDDG